MKIKLAFLSVLLIIGMLLSACSGAGDPEVTTGGELATEPPVEDNSPVTVVENYLPENIRTKIEELYVGGKGQFTNYSSASAPYTIRDLITISNCRVKSITIPVFMTLKTDADGNFKFTIHEVTNTYEGLKKAPIKTHTVLINAAEYDLKETSTTRKFITVDLSSYEIDLAKNETLALYASTDTLIPAYISNIEKTNPAAELMREFGVVGFLNKVGTADMASSFTTLFYDFTFERTYENRAAANAAAEEEAAYQARAAAVKEVLGGKYLSIMGDSISTYQGVSNNITYNSTIGNNAVWNTVARNFGSYNQIYWGHVLNDAGMKLCVPNAWSGSRVFGNTSSSVAGQDNMYLRSSQLANKQGQKPDVILIYMGINDVIQQTPKGKLLSVLGAAGSATTEERVDTWFKELQAKAEGKEPIYVQAYMGWEEAYALALYNMKQLYPDAKIYCFTLFTNARPTCTNAILNPYNTCIKVLADYFDVGIINQQEGLIPEEDLYTYGADDTALHPNLMGHKAIGRHVVNTLYEDLCQ